MHRRAQLHTQKTATSSPPQIIWSRSSLTPAVREHIPRVCSHNHTTKGDQSPGRVERTQKDLFPFLPFFPHFPEDQRCSAICWPPLELRVYCLGLKRTKNNETLKNAHLAPALFVFRRNVHSKWQLNQSCLFWILTQTLTHCALTAFPVAKFAAFHVSKWSHSPYVLENISLWVYLCTLPVSIELV